MASGSPPTLRIPLALLAIANLVILAIRLRPWHDALNLPVNGTSGIDPVVILLGYVGLIFWINSIKETEYQAAMGEGTMLGLLAGAILVGEVLIASGSPGQTSAIQIGLFVAASIVAGISGLRGARITGNAGIGMVSGIWCAMVGCLIACTAVLLKIDVATPQPLTSDPWKQYEGLAIGNHATQVLVHSLITATGFILVGPLIGGVLGLLFALFGQNDKS